MSDNVITFDVINKPKILLPSTGGIGVWLIYGTGALALIVASGYYFLRNKSKGET
ncbi:LPXTG cell wall anchor domain-containing protein [Enterococcus faecalis]|uniref:LPXTG cell wall anchor domain-containing protein n=1 Tax=Enterococcus faecalis TaxID=1351 RepID=UPI003CC6DCAE